MEEYLWVVYNQSYLKEAKLHYLERIILKSSLHVFSFLAFKIFYGFNVPTK